MSDTIHIQHASTEFDDSTKFFKDDMDIILDRGADVVNLTELTKRDSQLLRDLGVRHGYKYVDPSRRSDVGFYVKNKHVLWGAGATNVIQSEGRKPGQIQHSRRDVEFVKFIFEGNTISDYCSHWLTNFNGSDVERRLQNIELWRQLGDEVAKGGKGKSIAFWSGDVNWDIDDPSPNTPARIMDVKHLTTIYEELGRPQVGTLGKRQIDLIGSYDPDKRVTGKRLKVWPDETHIDHQQVSAWYEIAEIPS